MTAPQWHSAVVPARLSFLAIYNPSLGPTDDTFPDQLVFYHSRAAQESRSTAKKSARNDAAGGDAVRAEENEKLRQIGLAQGMVDFARSFSDGQAVDSVDTEKSRIVLREVEKGWWILASVDLTRLPAMTQSNSSSSSSSSSKKGAQREDAKPAIEYSSREVSPPALLLSQIVQAHFVFTLHHGPSLTELFVRLSRDKFCGILDRFWTRFARSWDVLLHGNPATDIFSGMKLSSGGELGMGVGEEEWGSGERDVLEDLTRRTEGLIDLVVSRFGDPAPSSNDEHQVEGEAVPWLGSGNYPLASDGVIFGGISAISRVSLRNISLWMRQIYTYGDYAYGVRDNPHRERRKRRRRNPPAPAPETETEADISQALTPPLDADGTDDFPKAANEIGAHDHVAGRQGDKLKPHNSVQGLEDSFSHHGHSDHAGEHRPGIPPPIVSAVQQSLTDATKNAEFDAKQEARSQNDASGTTLGIPDEYMKYLTFGLSTLAKPNSQRRPDAPDRASTSSSQSHAANRIHKQQAASEGDDDGAQLSLVDPMPDGQTLQDKITAQKRQEEQGLFVIGLKGDLHEVPDDPDASVSDADDESGGVRNVLRTVQVEITPSAKNKDDMTELQRKLSDAGLPSAKNDPLNFKRLRVLVYVRRPFMYCFLFQDRTPALGMAHFYKTLHQSLEPIYKPLLASTSVSRIAQRIEDAQAEASATTSDAASMMSGSKSQKTPEPKPIYDLIWDPALLAVHTSIPNIPEPGTPAAEGILSSKKDGRNLHTPDWTRVEALNIHSQILNTHASTQHNSHEYERTSKTSRGWWVVWMKLSSSKTRETAAGHDAASHQDSAKESGKENAQGEEEFTAPLESIESDDTLRPSNGPSTQASVAQSTRWLESTITTSQMAQQPTNRIAFLVRKATDTATPPKSDVTSRAMTSMWQSLSLRGSSTTDDATGGSRAGWGPAALAGGIGIDARKYVDGLLQLNR